MNTNKQKSKEVKGEELFMEGVKRGTVRLLPYNPNWEEKFQETKRRLEDIWRLNILAIEHVGSTAIKNISAKPILDIAVRLKSIKDIDIQSLVNEGYEYYGGVEKTLTISSLCFVAKIKFPYNIFIAMIRAIRIFFNW